MCDVHMTVSWQVMVSMSLDTGWLFRKGSSFHGA